MDVRIIVETTFEDGRKRSHRLDSVSRPVRQVGPENVGITMKDAQNLLRGIQETVLRDQIDEISEASRICPDCNKVRAIHDYRSRVFDTLFGRFRVKVPRIRHCNCSVKSEVELSGPFSPFAHVSDT